MVNTRFPMDELICFEGDVIFKEGEQGACMYKLLQGSAAVCANYGRTDERLLGKLNRGSFFGEMAVLEACPRSATVVALEDRTRLLVIGGGNLLDYLSSNGEREVLALMAHMGRRLRALTMEYTEVRGALRELDRMGAQDDMLRGVLFAKARKHAAVYTSRRGVAELVVAEPGAAPRSERHSVGFSGEVKVYRRGDVIFNEGDAADCMYDILSGRVGIYTNCENGCRKPLTVLKSNLFFGEMGMVGGTRRSATAMALENYTRVERITMKDFAGLIEKSPGKMLQILRHLSHRLRELTVDYLKVCRALVEAQEEIERASMDLSPEIRVRLETAGHLLMPEVIY